METNEDLGQVVILKEDSLLEVVAVNSHKRLGEDKLLYLKEPLKGLQTADCELTFLSDILFLTI